MSDPKGPNHSERLCWCTQCLIAEYRKAGGPAELLAANGNLCSNCGFYQPERSPGEGCCRKFGVKSRRNAVALVRRRQGMLPEGASRLIVGGAFSCPDFHPYHDTPEEGSPLLAFWADSKSDERPREES